MGPSAVCRCYMPTRLPPTPKIEDPRLPELCLKSSSLCRQGARSGEWRVSSLEVSPESVKVCSEWGCPSASLKFSTTVYGSPKSSTEGVWEQALSAGNWRTVHQFSVPVPSGIRLPVSCPAGCCVSCFVSLSVSCCALVVQRTNHRINPRHLDLRNNPLSPALRVDTPRGSSLSHFDGQASPSIRLQRSCPHGPQRLFC